MRAVTELGAPGTSGEEQSQESPTIRALTFVGAYLPGYKSGGPIRTMAGMVDNLRGSVEFSIVTADRDAGDEQAYPAIEPDRWHRRGGAAVLYTSPDGRSLLAIRRMLVSESYDVLYLNSLFNPRFTLAPLVLRRLGLIPRVPTVVAPRGELSTGALSLKPVRKRVFLALARASGLYRDVVWQASGKEEAEEIQRLFGRRVNIVTAANLRPKRTPQALVRRDPKRTGALRMAFLSRISPMKNVLGAIEALRNAKGEVTFDLYGPIARPQDREYWAHCIRAMEALPAHVRVSYRGVVPYSEVPETLADYHLFFLPTQGENYGHAIVDAMEAGCPVLLSDRTPWTNLEAWRAGWDVPLEDTSAFTRVLQKVIDMDHEEWPEWSAGARAYAQQHANSPESIEQNRALFRQALSEAG